VYYNNITTRQDESGRHGGVSMKEKDTVLDEKNLQPFVPFVLSMFQVGGGR
jgi:hypothetical protein